MRIACIQPKIHKSIEKCYSEIEHLLKNLLDEFDNCEIVCLPEKWTPLFTDIPQNFQEERGENYMFIKELANRYKVSFLSGAIWEKRNNQNKPYITCYFFDERGEEVGRQDKLHLYSYEKKYFEPGKELNIFNLGESKFAVLICFDLAFFETPRLAAENGADVLFSPTQIREEGMKNWNIYLQARALENRIPVVACNTVGTFFERKFLGNSKIISFVKDFVSPSKLKIIEATNNSDFIYDGINLQFPKKLRKIRLKERIEKNNIKVKVIKN